MPVEWSPWLLQTNRMCVDVENFPVKQSAQFVINTHLPVDRALCTVLHDSVHKTTPRLFCFVCFCRFCVSSGYLFRCLLVKRAPALT